MATSDHDITYQKAFNATLAKLQELERAKFKTQPLRLVFSKSVQNTQKQVK